MVFPPVKKFQFTITAAKCKKCSKPPGRSETLKPLRRVIVAARARSTSLQLPILDCGFILQESAQKINYPKQLFCLFSPPQHNGDEVQLLAAAGFHCLAVACGVLVVLGQPIGPDLLVARHLPDGEDFCPLAAGDDARPIGHVVYIVQLLRRPGQEQLQGQVVVAVVLT